jgi:hypothetical protein
MAAQGAHCLLISVTPRQPVPSDGLGIVNLEYLGAVTRDDD